MIHTPQEQPKKEAAQKAQHTTVETPKISPEVLSSPHDILGKEYEFNGISFTILGMDKEFYDQNDEPVNLPIDQVTVITAGAQHIPVIPFSGGFAYLTKIQIDGEIITDFDVIIKRIVVTEEAPLGWMTKNGLAGELKVSGNTITTYSDHYRQSNPEWFHLYKNAGGHLLEYYSPELCGLIKSEFFKREQALSGWMTNRGLAGELKVSNNTITTHANHYRQSNPEWFHLYRGAGNNLSEHFSPELCDLIRNEFSKREQAPLGWMTKNGLKGELKIDYKTITTHANHYRQSNPEWFHLYKDAGGRLLEHYSPELCNLIRDKIAKQEEAPLGWMTKNGLAGELRITYKTIMVYTDHYRQSHPDWFHEYKSKSRIAEHYAPQLCDLIRQAVKDKRS